MSSNLFVVNGSSTKTGHVNLLDIKVDEIIANTGIFSNLVIGTATFTTITVGTGIFNTIIAGTGIFTNLTASSGTITNLTTVNPIQAAAGIRGIFTSRAGAANAITSSGGFITIGLTTDAGTSGLNNITYDVPSKQFTINQTGLYLVTGNLSLPTHANMAAGSGGVGFIINGGAGLYSQFYGPNANDVNYSNGLNMTSTFCNKFNPTDTIGLQGVQTYTNATVTPGTAGMSISLLGTL